MKKYDSTRNPLIHSFETETPKDIRACAVKRCCDAFKTGFSNLRNGNIKHFNLKYKKKTDKIQSFELTPKIISIKEGKLRIAPESFGDECVLKTHKSLKDLKIENNNIYIFILRCRNEYYVHLSIPTEPKACESLERIAGVDLGIRTYATVHSGNDTIIEYKHRSDLLKKFNLKINLLKYQKRKKRTRKKQITKQEKKKIDCLHWEFINHLLKNNDVIYLGDIKSDIYENIVKGGKIKFLNVAFNDLKFYILKQRLIYKASVQGKKVFLVPEHYTTKTCSCCGTINSIKEDMVGSKEVFECAHCKMVTGRDMNASKNMKLKGFFL